MSLPHVLMFIVCMVAHPLTLAIVSGFVMALLLVRFRVLTLMPLSVLLMSIAVDMLFTKILTGLLVLLLVPLVPFGVLVLVGGKFYELSPSSNCLAVR